MFKSIFLVAWLVMGVCMFARAEAPTKAEISMAGGTIKTLAKAYIVTANLDQLKNSIIEKLNKLGPERYRQKYAAYYAVIRELPARLKSRYGITENMTREHLTRTVLSLNKAGIYELIEAIPDRVIAQEVKSYFDKDDPELKDKNFLEKVQMVWRDILGDMAHRTSADRP